jgi:hypothetical protein
MPRIYPDCTFQIYDGIVGDVRLVCNQKRVNPDSSWTTVFVSELRPRTGHVNVAILNT